MKKNRHNVLQILFFLCAKAIKRATKRDKSTVDKVKSQLKNQITNEKRIEFANLLINSNGSIDYVQAQVDAAWHLLNERLFEDHLSLIDVKIS